MEWNAVVDVVNRRHPWYRNNGEHPQAYTHSPTPSSPLVGIIVLNLCLLVPLLTASINGYDSSVVNGHLHPVNLSYIC